MKISLSTWLRALVIGWLLLLSSSLQATPPKASDLDYEFPEQGVSVGTENRLVRSQSDVGGDRSGDAPVPIKTFSSRMSNQSSLPYSGRSEVSPYDLLKSIPEDELFIADTGEDLDKYLFKERSPLTFNIDIKRYFGEVDSEGRLQNLSAMIENGVIEETAILRLRVWDVDDDYQGTRFQPERDVVKINGHVLPEPLSSGDDTWDTVSYSVPVEYLRFPELGSGSTRANKIEILIDEDNPLEDRVWAVEVDWAIFQVKGLRPLVLIHGYRGSPSSWDNFVGYLNKNHISYCLPGDGTTCGNKDPIDGKGCIRDNGNAINGVVEDALDRFGVSKVNLVAHSKGGLDARSYLRLHDSNGERTDSFIQLGTPNHGYRPANPLGSCAWRNLNPDWLNGNFNYTILDIDNNPLNPFDNQREFLPVYHNEQGATTGRFRHAIGDNGRNNDPDHGDMIVNHHSATPPWSVNCEQKDHRDYNTNDCPRFIVSAQDSWNDQVTWPLVVRLDQIFHGPNHFANNYRTQDFNWVLGEIRNMTESSQTSTQRFRHSVQQRTQVYSVQQSSTSRKDLLFSRQFVDVLPGNVHSYSITIGLADSVLFEVGHMESTTLEVSLTDPDGVVHTGQQHVELGAVVEGFEIQNPTQGNWTLMVNSGESQQYSLVVYEKGSPIQLKAYSDRKNYNIGDAVYLIGTLTNAGTPILGSTVIADVSEPSGTSQSFVLYDDGTHGDPTPGDGMYVNNEYVTSQEGEIRYTFSATDGITFQRQRNGSSMVVQESAQLTDVYTENVVDENGDGLYDELIIGVEINFLVVAPYEVFANLKDTNGSLIESLVTQFTPTQTGISTVQLRFYGKNIAEHGVNGPYQLNSLVLRRSLDTNYATVDYREDAYTTNAYQVDEFQGALIKLIGADLGEGVDSEGDSFFNYLVIQVEVDALIPGTYQTNARLVTQNGTDIEWTSETQSLGVGSVISLTFDGQKIRQTAENGPYILKDLVIAGQGTSLSLVEASETKAFNFNEFELIDIADFSIESEDLLLSTPIPLPGETIDISALVHNVGASTDEDIVVRIYEGNPLTSGSQIGNDHFIQGLTTGETSMVSENWTAPLSPGNYDIYVWVNPDRDVQEFDYNNNRAFKTVIVKPLQFAASTVDVAETTDTVTLTVRRLGGSSGELSVNYATTDGTATDGSDYVGATGTLTWADGDSSDKTVTVTILGDTVVEADETFTVTLSDPTSGASLDTATVTITDNDTSGSGGSTSYTDIHPGTPKFAISAIEVSESAENLDITVNRVGGTDGRIEVNYTTKDITSTAEEGSDYIKTSGTLIWEAGDGEDKSLTISIIDDAVVEGDERFYVNLLGTGSQITVTIKDNDQAPACLTSGTIGATCDGQGKTLSNFTLAAGINITNAILEGSITGDMNAPARLEDVEIKDNSRLSGVILTDTVTLGENVELTALLAAFTPSTDCVALQVNSIDLSKDIFETGKGILAAINAIPEIKSNGLVIEQEASCGSLQWTSDSLRFAVQPLSVKSTRNSAGMEELDEERVRFTTSTGLEILTHPAVQAPQALKSGLAALGLHDINLQGNGNLRIPEEGYWFSVRPDSSSLELSDQHDEGLFATNSPNLSNVPVFYMTFTDNRGNLREQFLYPAPAQAEALYSLALEAGIELAFKPYGLVSDAEDTSYGVLDYLVTKSQETSPDVKIQPISDVNGDGIDDWVLIYPNGNKQILFLMK